MSRTPRRYDAEQVRRFSDTTIAYYDHFARAFWNGTRHHDVSQNYAAFLDAIEGDPPYSILDLGCGPGRDLIHFRFLGARSRGARRISAIRRHGVLAFAVRGSPSGLPGDAIAREPV